MRGSRLITLLEGAVAAAAVGLVVGEVEGPLDNL